MSRFEIEIDVPEGYKAVAYDVPFKGGIHLGYANQPVNSDKYWTEKQIILEKIYLIPDFVPVGWYLSRSSFGKCWLSESEPTILSGDIAIPNLPSYNVDHLNFERPEKLTIHKKEKNESNI